MNRQVIVPSDQADYPPHTHDATQITGTFNFVRILKALINGDITISGFLRTAKTGNRIEIRPADSDVSSIQFFDEDEQTGAIEMEDQGSGVWALKFFGPDAGGGAAVIKLREDGIVVFDSDDSSKYIEFFKHARHVDGSAAAPSVRRKATATGWFFGSDFVAAAVAGSEVGRFTADGIDVAARGELDYAEVTADQGSIGGTFVALTDLDSTLTIPTGRRVKITGFIQVRVDAISDTTAQLVIAEDSTVIQSARLRPTTANRSETMTVEANFTSDGSEHTYDLRLRREVGTGTLSLEADSANIAFIRIEDNGPA